MIFFIDKLLDGDALETVQTLLAGATYVDGAMTSSVGRSTKSNLELKVDERYLKLMSIVDGAIERSDKLANRLLPRYRTAPIFSRYDTGMYFHEHVDSPIQGGQTQAGRSPGRFGQNLIRTDYSMTLFLNPPESYTGGELELKIGERTELVKLAAGSAVCYQTGVPHSVREVTAGFRTCAVYWFQSLIRDPGVRRTIWDMHCLERNLNENNAHVLADQAKSIKYNMIRYLSEI